MHVPEHLRYTKDHEWMTALQSGGVARVGVSAFAVEQLGDIVFMELPQVNQSFHMGESFGTIESTKTVSDLYMPVAATVLKVNQDILKRPEALQADSYDQGWLIEIRLTDPKEAEALLSAEAYKAYVES